MGLNTKRIFMLFNIFNIKTCMTSFHMHNTKEDKSENVSGFFFFFLLGQWKSVVLDYIGFH